MKSVLEQYNVADFIDWHKKKQLRLNPVFQRRSVWTPGARSYLIDTLLRGLPMPKVYMRTIIDVASQSSVRDIVDGQQRIRAVLDFARGELRLGRRAGEYAGLRYTDLDEEAQESFLGYAISVEQLMNASDEDVLEVFARLNSYTVPLNAAEIRHAKYQGDFKWKVREVATELGNFWTQCDILSPRDRLRMLDDQITAEMFGLLLEGIRDGGQPNINKLYDRHDRSFPEATEVHERTIGTTRYIDSHFVQVLKGDIFSRPPQFFILFAALAHALYGIPEGQITEGFPAGPVTRIDVEQAEGNLGLLAGAVLEESTSQRFVDFVRASSGSTQRIASRRVRFQYVWRALTEEV